MMLRLIWVSAFAVMRRIISSRDGRAYFRSSLASFAKFAAICRASSFPSWLAADRQPGFSSK
jgi:hypothetical protein